MARWQAGRISFEQLLSVGIDPGQIAYRVLVGRLHHVPGHTGVYAVGHLAASFDAAVWDAFLLGGDESEISATTAAVVQGVVERRRGEPIHVSVPRGTRVGGRRGTTMVHATRGLHPVDIDTLPGGLRVTSLARTFVELAAVVSEGRLRRALRRAAAAASRSARGPRGVRPRAGA